MTLENDIFPYRCRLSPANIFMCLWKTW